MMFLTNQTAQLQSDQPQPPAFPGLSTSAVNSLLMEAKIFTAA
jgi:hypothetical protein